MTASPAKEIKEYNKLGICMRKFANSFGMACGCEKCIEEAMNYFKNYLIEESK